MVRVQSARGNTLKQPHATSHVESARRYMDAVLGGDLPACKWVRLACERQRRNLKQSKTGAFLYRFDVVAAERICKFVELSPHVKGKKFAGTRIHLEDWQCFILTTVFGWLHKRTGLRRFRRSYIEVAKGNGKSALSSAIANYMAFAEGEPGAEVYSAATNRDQAKIIWSVSHAMLRGMPEFCSRAGVEPAAHSINQLRTNSFFRPLSSEANSAEGVQPYFTCVDELHAHPSRDLYDNLDTANGKRQGSLLWSITTAGSDRAGICYEQHLYVGKILDGVAQDESYFGIIFTLDDEDRWTDEGELKKANPNWGVSVDPAEIMQKVNKALQIASAQPGFKTKHGNIWCNADHAWMDMQRWAKCADPTMTLENFGGERCIVGLDLASKLDLLAKVKLFWKDTDEKRHYYVFGDYWTPEARLDQTQNSQYKGWVIDGKLHTCPGETNDYDVVEDAIRTDCRQFEVLEVAHDPYQAQQFVNHLQPEGIKMAEVPQTAKLLSEPMKELEAAVYDGRFHFDGDPILTWAISNVVCHIDKNDNLFPNKERYENKIDPVTALLTAMRRLMDIDAGEGSGGGVSVFNKCARCTSLTEGQMINGKMIFDCGKHGGRA
jgi:phage terminase large subunit-like protein